MISPYGSILWSLVAPVALAIPDGIDSAVIPRSLNVVASILYAHLSDSLRGPVSSSEPQPQVAASTKTFGEGEYALRVVNSYTAAVSTEHRQRDGGPTAIRDDRKPHTIGVGETATFAVPTGWAGVVAIADAAYPLGDRASLIEGSFMVQDGSAASLNGDATMALDISYVDGFTVPIVCECQGKVVAGCNLDLNVMCPDQYRLNDKTCINPHRAGKVQGVENFFQACAPMAYTLPDDHLATVNGLGGCEGHITCCVGTVCSAHPGQFVRPAE